MTEETMRGGDRDGVLRAHRRLAVGAILLAVLGGSAALAQEGADEAAGRQVARYTIEVVVRPTLEGAKLQADAIQRQLDPAISVRVEYRPPGYAIRVGDFATAEEAQPVLDRIVEIGFEDASITPIAPPAEQPELEGPPVRTDAERPPAPEPPAEAAEPAAPAEPPAEPAPAVKPAPPGKRIHTAQISNGALTIDGRLDESAWSSASFVSDFLKKAARRGYPPHEKTEVAVLYDEEALYIGARIHMSNGGDIRARRSQRDDAADADRIIVSLDTYRNRQTAYNFGVTAGGTRIDYYQPQDVFEVRDYTFDPVWHVRTSIRADGWSAEMRIPFSSLRFHGGDSKVWGINIQRVSPAIRLYAFWVVVPGDDTGWSSRFGDLVGLDGIRPVRRIALVPYVTGQSVRDEDASTEDPFAEDGESDWRYGGDFLADLTPNLSLEATFNPDFGQIEADPAVINLSAYEVFFPEKRPFFLEGAQLLQGLGPRYYYSRRIGAPPHGRVNLPFHDTPVDTTIAGAAKLIGRQPDGLSVGTLLAVTEEEHARTFDPATEEFGRAPVEPRTMFAITRLQKDFGAGSTVGVIGTGLWRDFPAAGTLDGLLPRGAYAGGFDWNLRFGEQSYVFGGFAGASLVEGDPAAILRLQRASARYLQRPDADYVGLDPTRTSLDGYTGGLQLARIKGAWRWSVSGEARSPGFEINDAGAMATADDITSYASLSYHTPRPIGPWRRIDVGASISSGWNFGEIRQFTTPAAQVSFVWRNFWQTYFEVARDLGGLSDSLTRGGPLMATAEGWRTKFGVSTNQARQWVWSADGSYSADDLDGWSYGASTRALVRFADRFTFSIMPGYERSLNTRQYFATLAGDRLETFNQRYVFAALDQKTAYARLRVGLAVTPRLGLDLYVEPFAAVGSYDRFGELAAARSSDLRTYGVAEDTTLTRLEDGSYVITDGEHTFTLANGDFDVTSLRGNAVLRWDYAEGSSLYLVWAQTRDAEDVLGGQVRPGDLVDVFDAPVRNVFAVKASFRVDLN